MKLCVIVLQALVMLFMVLPAHMQEPVTISIGSFNIQQLGETDQPERITHLAEVCKGIDLLAVQEVHPDGQSAVEALAAAMGSEYLFAVSEETTWERFAFIWRFPVEMQGTPVLLEKPKLGRKPFFAAFKAGNFDFEIMNVHLFWDGSKKTYPHARTVEFKLLDDWLCYRESTELDLLIVGDFNTPGVFYGYQFPPPLSSSYFFYEFMARHNLISVSVDKRIPTSIMNQSIYDHIIFNPSKYFVSEFTGIQFVEIVRWDAQWDVNNSGYLEWNEYEAARKMVSDHRLVKAVFAINMPDDDGVPSAGSEADD